MILFPANPVLLIDDEISALESFEMTLNLNGVNHIRTLSDSREVLNFLAQNPVDCILLDLVMPHLSGQDLLRLIRENYPEVPVIIVTALNTVEQAVECMKNGAYDYLVKPVEKNRLVSGVKRAVELTAIRKNYLSLRDHFFSDRLEHPEAFTHIITQNSAMHAIFQYVEVIASSPEPVLITGETGVGKELIARAIHHLSNRKGKFVPVNIAGVDDTIFSDTLFGHDRGAFTGAIKSRRGMVDTAAGGTLFLDEIADLNPASQVKLLRLLQEYEYYPLGSDLPKYANTRIIVATNQQLEPLIKSGRFRKDLYHRICVHKIHLPPLRERLDDLPLLIEHFLAEAGDKLQKQIPAYPKELIQLLRTYHFPGNLRELRAMVFDAVGLHKSRILSLHSFRQIIGAGEELQTAAHETDPGTAERPLAFPSPLPTLKQVEQLLIQEALLRSSGNQAIAAQLLGISRQALNQRLKRGVDS